MEHKPNPTTKTEGAKRVKRKRVRENRPKDMPRRALSAYNIFFKLERRRWLSERAVLHTKALPSASPKERSSRLFHEMGKTIGSRWQALSQEERSKYHELARKDANRFRMEMEEYHSRLAKATSTLPLNSQATSLIKQRAEELMPLEVRGWSHVATHPWIPNPVQQRTDSRSSFDLLQGASFSRLPASGGSFGDQLPHQVSPSTQYIQSALALLGSAPYDQYGVQYPLHSFEDVNATPIEGLPPHHSMSWGRQPFACRAHPSQLSQVAARSLGFDIFGSLSLHSLQQGSNQIPYPATFTQAPPSDPTDPSLESLLTLRARASRGHAAQGTISFRPG